MPPKSNEDLIHSYTNQDRPAVIYTDAPASVALLTEGRFMMPTHSSVFISWATKQLQTPMTPTTLSIRWACNGQRFFQTQNSRHVVDDASYMLFNEGQESASEIDSAWAVHCYTVCFRLGMVEDVLRAHVTPADRLLDDPQHQSTQPVTFLDKVYAHDTLVSPLLARLQQQCTQETATYGWFEEQFHELLLGLLQAHRNVYREIESLPAVRAATRAELYQRLHRARDFMEASLEQPLTLANIAHVACFSPFHFLRLFKQVFGETPHSYLTRLRLERAQKLLLQTEMPITDICFAIGFESLGSFSTLFHRHVGLTPVQFRRERRKETR